MVEGSHQQMRLVAGEQVARSTEQPLPDDELSSAAFGMQCIVHIELTWTRARGLARVIDFQECTPPVFLARKTHQYVDHNCCTVCGRKQMEYRFAYMTANPPSKSHTRANTATEMQKPEL